ncbi:MAG TPA: MFS transporter [Candidatus Kapabacteria bacterium]|nr:MFS transporter [Candidatus Kapabacteria bacterium]
MNNSQQTTRAVTAAIIVAALGYFVDIYDLILFSIVRKPSLLALQVPVDQLKDVGGWLMNWQMGGMLLGGILWGILGDRRGRLSVLFGSILLYSIANISNGMVNSLPMYAVLRFIAGIGLAGELGAGITLVSEIMHRENRGYGTTIVASVGILGAVAAWLVGDAFGWRNAFYVGGGMGLVLLVLRVSVYESGMFTAMKESDVARGSFFSFFSDANRRMRYLRCILIGLPLWFVVGILVFYGAEFGAALIISRGPIPGTGFLHDGFALLASMTPPLVPDSGKAVMFCYIGLAAGDMASGLLSQILRSRKKTVLIFLMLTIVSVAVYLLNQGNSLSMFYALCVGLGIGSGYWAVFVTIASEQFGTNIRATATTTVPNFVRGTVVLLNAIFLPLSRTSLGVVGSAAVIGAVVIGVALMMLRGMDETFGKDLDYVEGIS